MGQGIDVLVCPRGHTSSEADYCSECGAKMQGSSSAAPSTATAVGDVCPDCGTVREPGGVVFCEVCGYNFVTGAHGEVLILTPEPEPESIASAASELEPAPAIATAPQQWAVQIAVDPSLRSAESPEPPVGIAPATVLLQQPVSLIGRKNEARAIFPEISLDFDEAVSRRHALLQVDPQHGLLLRDIGSANGTRLNGKDLEPMTDYPVHPGDEIALGHWTRLTVQAS